MFNCGIEEVVRRILKRFWRSQIKGNHVQAGVINQHDGNFNT